MDPYRTATLAPVEKPPTNVYRYVVLDRHQCPVCQKNVTDTKRVYRDGLAREDPLGSRDYCHPLKRVVVKGFWFWKKYCPVEKVHHHCFCYKCEVSWIEFNKDDNQFEPKYEERIL